MVILSCHKNDGTTTPPVPVNPCAGKTGTSAAFIMYEDVQLNNLTSQGWEIYDTDTANSAFVTFKAKDSLCTSYTWQIGAGTYSGRSVKINFLKNTGTTNVPVSLTVTKQVDTACYPGDKGTASLSRSLVVQNGYDSLNVPRILGKYFGYLNGNLLDTLTLSIGEIIAYGGNTCNYFPNNCRNVTEDDYLVVKNLYRNYVAYLHTFPVAVPFNWGYREVVTYGNLFNDTIAFTIDRPFFLQTNDSLVFGFTTSCYLPPFPVGTTVKNLFRGKKISN